MNEGRSDWEISDDPARVDRDALWAFLSTEPYWGRWRDRSVIERQVDGAWRVVGAYHRQTGEMVGFARAVSDGVALAYLADVYVLAAARGHGLGTRLVRVMIDDGPGAEFRWMLHTADAHPLYRRFGFAVPDDTYLERPARLGTTLVSCTGNTAPDSGTQMAGGCVVVSPGTTPVPGPPPPCRPPPGSPDSGTVFPVQDTRC